MTNKKEHFNGREAVISVNIPKDRRMFVAMSLGIGFVMKNIYK